MSLYSSVCEYTPVTMPYFMSFTNEHPVDRYHTSFTSLTGTRRPLDQGHTSSDVAAIMEVVLLSAKC